MLTQKHKKSMSMLTRKPWKNVEHAHAKINMKKGSGEHESCMVLELQDFRR